MAIESSPQAPVGNWEYGREILESRLGPIIGRHCTELSGELSKWYRNNPEAAQNQGEVTRLFAILARQNPGVIGSDEIA